MGHTGGNRKIKPESGRVRPMAVLRGTDRDRTFEPVEKGGIPDEIL